MAKKYVQYGCGLSAPKEWTNFDVSPTLRIQKTPILGALVKSRLNVVFPSNVLYGNIIKGLPVADNSCDGLYCSHTLEHLAFNEFKKALVNSYKVLKPGGIFRCIVPDLEFICRTYISNIEKGQKKASISFISDTIMGITERPKGMKGMLKTFLGASHHLWMWDQYSMAEELKEVGFKSVRLCKFDDSSDEMFKLVESEDRFVNSVAFECIK